MPNTPVQALPYPALSDPANGPVAFQNLATALEDYKTIIRCTSSTRPGHVEGRTIYETDTDRLMVSDGATWQPALRTAAGVKSFVFGTAGGYADVVFPTGRFAAAPCITITTTATTNVLVVGAIASITATGFRVYLYPVGGSWTSGNVDIHWQATAAI